jgi:hypothetical protein
MKWLLNQNIIILSGFIKEIPVINNTDIQNQDSGTISIAKTSINFYFYSSENAPLSSVKIVAWGRNAQDLEKIPIGEPFTITGVFRHRTVFNSNWKNEDEVIENSEQYAEQREQRSMQRIPEIFIKIIQRGVTIDD